MDFYEYFLMLPIINKNEMESYSLFFIFALINPEYKDFILVFKSLFFIVVLSLNLMIIELTIIKVQLWRSIKN